MHSKDVESVSDSNDLLDKKVMRKLHDRLFAIGAMEEPPCFCCGYNGHGYYNPAQHACAARHHKLSHKDKM
jgi:hypothetical protein